MMQGDQENIQLKESRFFGDLGLDVTDGVVYFIDQFMLGNQQFVSQLAEITKEVDPSSIDRSALALLFRKYGGSIVTLEKGTYHVYRDPISQVMALFSETCLQDDDEVLDSFWQEGVGSQFDFDAFLAEQGNVSPTDSVFIDTRCLCIANISTLFKTDMLQEFQELRSKGEDKPARDLLREHGVHVRYGFNRQGDELAVLRIADPGLLVLWPDVVD